MIRLHHADEWVGLLVVVAVVLFLGVILHAGLLRDWFRPVSHLRIVLPEAGVAGLSVGADVEILGTQAGTLRRIVISPAHRPGRANRQASHGAEIKNHPHQCRSSWTEFLDARALRDLGTDRQRCVDGIVEVRHRGVVISYTWDGTSCWQDVCRGIAAHRRGRCDFEDSTHPTR